MPEEYKNQIVTGDARELAKRLPDESVDFIFTDPPYPKEYLYLYGELAELSARALKPGGSVMALAGHYYLPEVFILMSEHLDYVWTAGMGHSGHIAPVWLLKLWATWKPMVWYSKGKPNRETWFMDFYRPDKPDKRHHKWGQAASHAVYYIDKMTTTNDVVFDPFTGGGTVPAVCKMLGRNYIAFEIDPDTAELARERVRNTQPPLFVMEPEQLGLLDE